MNGCGYVCNKTNKMILLFSHIVLVLCILMTVPCNWERSLKLINTIVDIYG